jgi:AraC-like DNA-binding protein
VISPIESTYSNADEKFMINLNALINKNLSNSTLDVQFIADNMAMSRASIYNKMKELVGIGIKDYINKIRLTEATRLLVNTDLTIMEIADKTGFSNQQYFSTVFKQAYGTSRPSIDQSRPE